MKKVLYKNINDYIKSAPKEAQGALKQVRTIIKKVVPKATEDISYQMPTFKYESEYLIYFAGSKNHVGIYPIFEEMIKKIPRLNEYRQGKATVRFPINKPLPVALIKKLVQLQTQKRIKDINIKKTIKKK